MTEPVDFVPLSEREFASMKRTCESRTCGCKGSLDYSSWVASGARQRAIEREKRRDGGWK